MKSSTSENYRKRLLRVIDYMHEHIGDNLDVNTLADVACMSPYHFHRIYRQMAQETVNATVRRLRLQAAASDLIRTDISLEAIAHKMAYSSQEAFSRAFLKEFGEAQGEYRNNKHLTKTKWEPFVAMLPAGSLPILSMEQSLMFDVEIKELPETNVMGMAHQGDYMNIGQVFEKVGQFAVANELYTESTKSIGVYYDDPKFVAVDELRSMACVTLEKPIEISEESVTVAKLPARKYATLLFKGSYAELEKPYDWFFGQWLPESGYDAGEFPPFEEYVNDPKSTAPNELLTRIHCLLV